MLKKLKPIVKQGARKLSIAAHAAILCMGITTNAQAIPFNQISAVYFFGDSLSDSGYGDAIPGLPPGKAPTITTFGGYTWAQYVARDIKGFPLPVYPGPNPPDLITNNTTTGPIPLYTTGSLTGVNYSAAGSTTNSTGFAFVFAPSLHAQVTNYLQNFAPIRLDPNAVYFVWSGANDFITVLANPPAIPPDQLQLLLLQTAQTAATNIANDVASLSARGAKRIVVLSLPNLALTPFVQLGAPNQAGAIKNVIFTFNGMLNTQLGRVIAQFPQTKILYIDTFFEVQRLVVSTNAGKPYVVGGRSFMFTNATLPACSAPSALFCSSADSTAHATYAFADSVHPTDLGHQAITALVESKLLAWK